MRGVFLSVRFFSKWMILPLKVRIGSLYFRLRVGSYVMGRAIDFH